MSPDNDNGVTRREFVSTATGAAVGTILAASAPTLRAQAKRRYAIVALGFAGSACGALERRWFRRRLRRYFA